MKSFFLPAMLGLLGAIPLGSSAVPPAAPLLRITSKSLEIGVDRASGQIVDFTDLASQHNFAASSPQGGLWEIELSNGSRLTPMMAHRFEVAPVGSPAGLHFRWSSFSTPQYPELNVDVIVRLHPNVGLSSWQIQLHNTDGLNFSLIRFPRLLNIPEQPQERLAVPVWMGQELANPRAALGGKGPGRHRMEWSYPGLLSMQCLTLTSDKRPGLYLACDDAAGQLKDFSLFSGTNGALNLEIAHRPEIASISAQEYVLPYSVVLGVIRGGWFSAAKLYQAWATNQTWATTSRLKQGLVPPWTTNTALWIWNRGPSPGVLEPAAVLQKQLGLPVSVFWHWWHGCAYDTGFPEYLPPREGAVPFRAAVQRAHSNGLHAIVYMNQRLWGMTTTSWTNENASRFAVKAADGEVKPEVYNTFARLPCASMCIGTEFWRNKYAGLAVTAINELGLDGIYMDQACSSLACFDSSHGHTIGGGTYWMNGFKLLASQIRNRCEAAGPALAGEGCGENWLPYLDLMLSLQVSRERYAGADGWETIPFFHSVYHGYGVFYGNYSSLTMPPYDSLWPPEFGPKEPLKLLDRKFSRQFYLEQARAFVWGQQPTIANFLPSQLTSRAAEVNYVLRLAKIHAGCRRYLQQGELLAPVKVEVPQVEIPMSRLSIYAGQQEGPKEFRKAVPEVLAAAWRAPNGAVAIAVASISDEPSNPALRVELPRQFGANGRVYRIDETGRSEAGKFAGRNPVLKPRLAPRDACLFELLP